MNAWSQTYPLNGCGRLHIHQQAGPVNIVGVPAADVKVTATCKEELDLAEHLHIRQEGHTLVVEVKPRHWFLGGTPGIRLDIELPQGTPCQVESGSGSVEISSTGAPVRIETGSGGVKVNGVGHADIETGSGPILGRHITGSVSAETGSGGVEFSAVDGALSIEVGSGPVVSRQIRGDLRVETGSGQLTVEDVEGRVDLETGSGSVLVRRVRGAAVAVDSGGGSLHLQALDVAQVEVDASSGGVDVELLQVYPGGSYSITTGSGGVVVAVPATADLRVRAEASSGRIHHSGLALKILEEESGELDAILGQGRADLQIEAGSGGIRLVSCGGDQPANLSAAGARVVEAVKDDPALGSSDQLRRIVTMVEEGKLTPQEAEELLRALDEEEPS